MDTLFDKTDPTPSRWDQEGAEFVASNEAWCTRCAARLKVLNPSLSGEMALHLAQETSLNDNLRALSPELVADDVLSGFRLRL